MKAETKRLILQYKEYTNITSKINNLNSRLIRYKILGEVNDKNDLKTKIKLLERLQSRISDEMSFKDPIIWIEYKYYAYKGTSKSINTLLDLYQHCLPKDYICTKRFNYLNKFIDTKKFKGGINLLDFLKKKCIKKIVENEKFMEGWQKYEYYINNGRIAKWENYE